MASDIHYIKEKMDDWGQTFKTHTDEVRVQLGLHDERIRTLENWKLVFVTKFTVYSTIALFLGSALSQVLVRYLIDNI